MGTAKVPLEMSFPIALGVSLTEDILNRLENVGWSTESEALTIRLLEEERWTIL